MIRAKMQHEEPAAKRPKREELDDAHPTVEVQGTPGMEGLVADGDHGSTRRAVRANDVIELVFGERQNGEILRPPYMHQIFPDEMIQGYDSSLRITLHFSPCSLRVWLDVQATTNAAAPGPEAGGDERTDIVGLLGEKMQPGSFDLDQASLLKNAGSFALPDGLVELEEYKAGSRTFVLLYCPVLADNQALRDWHRRMQFVMYMYIETASYIDDTDPRWELLLVVEKETHAFVGYTTCYRFSTALKSLGSLQKYGFVERLRLAQIVVLPTYRSQGHAIHMLQAVYKLAQQRSAMEVSIEDPSPRFSKVRDVVDYGNAISAKLIETSLMDTKDIMFAERPELVEAMRAELKITPKQAKRLIEIDLLRQVDPVSQSELYKQFRLLIKRRLWAEFHHNQILKVYTPEEKKVKLAELYQDIESEYAHVIASVKDKLGVDTRFRAQLSAETS
ncbi:Histone acetyltransferase type B catalytic subunit [Porphyridium purpureum]|uniref:histone acetyltransferase n=1 Tax=Porphyridium purpureum TaxID=35688 RepID=A0A5J4Z3P2_PORPP|nr:Histone acetyltransferase type B catalytic subunit [Porphyridium purpureum]|eukprot:POR0032..scf295_1